MYYFLFYFYYCHILNYLIEEWIVWAEGTLIAPARALAVVPLAAPVFQLTPIRQVL